jgi:hypothetical protein
MVCKQLMKILAIEILKKKVILRVESSFETNGIITQSYGFNTLFIVMFFIYNISI